MVVQIDNTQSTGIPGMVVLNFASWENIIYYDDLWKYDAHICLLSERTHSETITLSNFKNRNEIVTVCSGMIKPEMVRVQLEPSQAVILSSTCRIGTMHVANLRR